jgi:predicted amidohydrolase
MTRALAALQERILKLLLSWRSRPGLVQRSLAQAAPGLPETETPAPHGRVRVAAVQMRLELMKAERYASLVVDATRRAAQQGAKLVVFPEDVGSCLLGLIPGIEKRAGAGGLSSPSDGIRPADVLRFVAPAVRRVHEPTFSFAAKRFGAHIVAGSVRWPNASGALRNVSQVYGPDGRLLGEQEKCHLMPMEVDWGLSPGDDLSVFEADWGKFASPVCMDATYFETFRIVASRGAEVVAITSANAEEYSLWRELRGIWARVQESQVYGVRACMVGSFLGQKLTGRGGVFAPLELSPQGDGVLAQAAHPEQEELVVADLDLVALRALRRHRGVERAFNLAVCKRYLPSVYGALAEPFQGVHSRFPTPERRGP